MQRRVWTDQEVEVMFREYEDPNIFPIDIARRLNRSLNQVYNKAQAMGLKAPMERIKAAGKIGAASEACKAHQFSKGHVPLNKGKRLSPEVYEKVKTTMFKKGHAPVNHREVGSERVNVDGYIEIKVAEPNKWKLKHRVIWESHNGKIPPGHNIQFKNHNTQDCRIENLYMISQAEQMRNENSFIAKYPKELQDVIRLKGVVKRQIHKHQRQEDNEQ